MIISISGASCTGKTTLIKELAKKGYPVITPSASRIVAGRTFNSQEEKTQAIFDVMTDQLAKARAMYQDSGKHVFLDRSYIDMLSFRHAMKLPEAPWEKEAREQCWRIHLVVLCSPVEVAFHADGVRPEDLNLRDNWHYQLIADCNANNLRYILAQGTVPERLALIEKTIAEM